MQISEKPLPFEVATERLRHVFTHEPYAVAILDMDFMNDFQTMYGDKFKLSGKIRMLIDEAIRDLTAEGAEFEKLTAQQTLLETKGDESLISIWEENPEAKKARPEEGAPINLELIEGHVRDFLMALRKEVIKRTVNRIGYARLTNLEGLTNQEISKLERAINSTLHV